MATDLRVWGVSPQLWSSVYHYLSCQIIARVCKWGMGIIPDEFIFTGGLCGLKRELRVKWCVKTPPPPPDRCLLLWNVEPARTVVQGSRERFKRNIFIMWICEHISKENTCFLSKILKMFSTKGKIWFTASVFVYKKSLVPSRLRT